MKLKRLIGLAALCCPLAAFALDENPNLTITPLMKTTASWDGKPIVYPKGQSEVTGIVVEIAPAAETGWHEHPVPGFGYILEGELELTLASGETKILRPGDAIAESVGVLHNGRNTGDEPVKIVAFFIGEVGNKISIAHPEFALPSSPGNE